ncbi:MAG: hypothetical protein R6U98_23985 [Pirellulaceae bacterium]
MSWAARRPDIRLIDAGDHAVKALIAHHDALDLRNGLLFTYFLSGKKTCVETRSLYEA